jgi:serine/threonine protein kinase
MTDRVGQQLGNYHLICLLGRGGFAEVYLGEHLRLKTQAAIKVLHTSLEGDDIDSFLREAQTVAHLKHPHIVRVFDFDVEEHIPFLVMDYLPNGNVRQRHPKGTPLPLLTIVSYVTQVASALQYAHDEKLIHRDIKPENMLLDQRNTIVLSDFGIALMAQSSRYQNTQEVAGTAAYMAPEQFQGKPRRASDQYALGVVVYEWLSGERPFHGSFTEIASQHLFVPPPSLQKKMPMNMIKAKPMMPHSKISLGRGNTYFLITVVIIIVLIIVIAIITNNFR